MGAGQRGALQQVLLDGAFVPVAWLVVLESPHEFISMIEDLLDRTGHCDRLRDFEQTGLTARDALEGVRCDCNVNRHRRYRPEATPWD
jgi:hypothetical protein